MTNHNPVLWQEGMFLKPQHFQQQYRHLSQQIYRKPTSLGKLGWGIDNLIIDETMLELGQISIQACSGVFADGTLFDAPSTDDLPPILKLEPTQVPTVVYLGIALRNSYSDLESPDQSIKRITSANIQIQDECEDFRNSATITVSRFNIKLLLDSDDHHGFTAIPIMRVHDITSSNQIILDSNFIPSCLLINASQRLTKYLRECITQLLARAKAICQIIGDDTGYSGTAEFSDYMILQLINRYEPLLSHYYAIETCHPEQLYRTLLQFVGELSTFTAAHHRQTPLQPYQQHNLTMTFQDIFTTLTHLIGHITQLRAICCPLSLDEFGIWSTQFEDRELLSTCDLVLIVKTLTQQGKTDLGSQLPKLTKIASSEQIHSQISHGLQSIPVKLLQQAPRQVPYYLDGLYFLVDTSHKNWEAVVSSGQLSIHINGLDESNKFELWAIRR